jgi:hypothetical protein
MEDSTFTLIYEEGLKYGLDIYLSSEFSFTVANYARGRMVSEAFRADLENYYHLDSSSIDKIIEWTHKNIIDTGLAKEDEDVNVGKEQKLSVVGAPQPLSVQIAQQNNLKSATNFNPIKQTPVQNLSTKISTPNCCKGGAA